MCIVGYDLENEEGTNTNIGNNLQKKRKRSNNEKYNKTDIKRRKISANKNTSSTEFTTTKINTNKTILKFKVENSWGNIGNNNGFYLMTVDWFKQFGYQIVINKKHLTNDQNTILNTKPIKMKRSDSLSYVI